jgi:phosphodiesterase/alkaline phosphatase D-like protein
MSDDKRSSPRGTSRREILRSGLVATVGVTLGCGGGNDPADAGMIDDDGGRARDGGSTPEVDAGLDAGLVVEQVPPPEAVTESMTDFPLGVASGDATTTSAIFWTSYAGSSAIELVVWEMDGDTYGQTVFVGPAVPVESYVHVDVGMLTPGRRYRYTFFVQGRTARSAIGRMRSAIGADALEPLVIGAVSCTSNTRDIPTLGHAGGRTDLDLFVFLGDSTYNDGDVTLAEYRTHWAQNVGRAEYRAVRGASSMLATWDDHEFDNDWNPETFDAAQRAAAIQTFFEHQALRRDPANPDRVWKSVRWGRTAEIFVLDCRAERRPSTRDEDNAEYISRAQMDWLKAGLIASTAIFKIIVNSVPITNFPGVFDLAQNDRWEGYAPQRTEILSFIDMNLISGVIWLAGDFHLASAGRVSTSGFGQNQIELLAGPGAQTGNPGAFTLGAPQFDFATTTNNYTLIELDPTMGRFTATWIDGDGDTVETIDYDI